jgi:hypothetical protein
LQDEIEESDVVKAIPISSKLPSGHFDPVVVLQTNDAEATGMFFFSTDLVLFTGSSGVGCMGTHSR